MEKTISINKKDLKVALSEVKSFVEKKNTMPILSHILINVFATTCEIVGTDLEVAFKAHVPCRNDRDITVKICVPCVMLYQAVQGIKTPDITITFQENAVLINETFKIMTLPASDFPAWPELKGDVKTATIPGFLEKLSRVFVAAGESDTRYTLNTVCLDFENGFIAGSDGHRLHYEDIPVKEGYGIVMIPRNTVNKMIKNTTKDTISFSERHLTARVSGGQILTRVIEGNYPHIENIIENEKDTTVRVLIAKSELVDTLKSASLLSKSRANGVTLTVNGGLVIKSSNPDAGEFLAKIACKRDDGKHEDITIGINARYLLEGIAAYSTADVVLDIQADIENIPHPMFVNGHGIVMPLRV